MDRTNEEQEEEQKLTPHTLRLIKLITSCSSSSASDHVRHAIALLSTIASKSHPYLLWDILARLYSSLTNPNEVDVSNHNFDDNDCIVKREHIALAMEHVARYIPSSDRRHFLMDSNVGSNETEYKDWLKVNDFIPSDISSKDNEKEQTWETLEQVLRQGRLLLSSSGLQYENNIISKSTHGYDYEKEHSVLSSLDSSAISSSSAKEQQALLNQRIKFQRLILAKRLGLGGILSSDVVLKGQKTSDGNNHLNYLITDEDLIGESHIVKPGFKQTSNIQEQTLHNKQLSAREKNMKRLQKRKQMTSSRTRSGASKKQKGLGKKTQNVTDNKNKENDDENKENDDEEEYPTIRNILLLSLHHHSKNSHHMTKRVISHQHPQILLATDMIYNSFHPSWHVRHGSLLGLLSLLKAWHQGFTKCNDNKIAELLFGVWPEDIVCRCLCILALDRFGDFAGSLFKAADNDTTDEESAAFNDFQGRAFSAPVRETAARVLSMLLSTAPIRSIQLPCYQVLSKLVSFDQEWEVRHGAKLTFKYIIDLMREEYDEETILMNSHLDHSLWMKVSNHAITGLKDKNDEVKGASAQLLSCFVTLSKNRNIASETLNLIPLSVTEIWHALNQVQDTSSCTLDLLILFSQIITADCQVVLDSLEVCDPTTSRCTVEKLLMKMSNFLSFQDFSIQLCSFHTLSSIVIPISEALINSETDYKAKKEQCCETLKIYCDLLVNLFNSFFYNFDDFGGSETAQTKILNEKRNALLFCSAREEAWSSIVNAAKCILSQVVNSTQIMHETFLVLIFRLLNVEILKGQLSCVNRNVNIEWNIRSKTSARFRCLTNGCKALIELYQTMNLETITERSLSIFVMSLMASPWSEMCESACILVRSLFSNNSHSTASLLLSEYERILMNMLTTIPPCIVIENQPHAAGVLEDESIIKVCLQTLFDSIQMQKGEVRNTIEALHEVNEQINQVVGLWSKCFKTLGVKTNEITSVNLEKSRHQMRIAASIAGALISLGPEYLPSKLSSVIRALITSIQNEEVLVRSDTSCQDMSKLLYILNHSPQSHRNAVHDKVLEKICNMCINDPHYYRNSTASLTSYGWRAAQKILHLVVQSHHKNTSLSRSKVIWKYLACLHTHDPAANNDDDLISSIMIFTILSSAFEKQTTIYRDAVTMFLPTLAILAFTYTGTYIRQKCVISVINSCLVDPDNSVPVILPTLLKALNSDDDDARRLGACVLMNALVEKLGTHMISYVRCFLPISMSMMTDNVDKCAKLAAATFAHLVRLAPLVQSTDENDPDIRSGQSLFKNLVDHLIHGKPLPSFPLPTDLVTSLSSNNIELRNYQTEGISWLCLLSNLKLNGALCDDMGLGKTIQALIAIIIAHEHTSSLLSSERSDNKSRSLIVCPSSVVGHWMNEIRRIDPVQRFLSPLSYIGRLRHEEWKNCFEASNLVVTSYQILRSDSTFLQKFTWVYCVLDEGHLIKNPKTATAKAARCLRPKNKLILSGSPVQNNVQELWATFDWLMPNYLGSESDFAKRFGNDITRSQLPGSSAGILRSGMNKLKQLHQQVLPFILRREKGDVLQQLPPKVITDVPCYLTDMQSSIYDSLCSKELTKDAIKCLQSFIDDNDDSRHHNISKGALKSLMNLRMLCTHPIMLGSREIENLKIVEENKLARFDVSGKLCALCDILRGAGILREDITAADNDESMIYVQDDNLMESIVSDSQMNYEPEEDVLVDISDEEERFQMDNGCKCLIFAQFTQSLDIVENLIFKPLVPSLRYVRLDGSVNPKSRENIVEQFRSDESVKCMLLSTKVGSLGLNLQAANIVIFLEPDYNPHVDLQAMDRAHRLGQEKTVYVYRLITANTIEEKILSLQTKKLAISDAIINTDNSTLFSMGTDKLLDLFDTQEDDCVDLNNDGYE